MYIDEDTLGQETLSNRDISLCGDYFNVIGTLGDVSV